MSRTVWSNCRGVLRTGLRPAAASRPGARRSASALPNSRVLQALQLPQRIGHRGVREHGVVPAHRARLVQVERLEVVVDPVAAAHAGDHAQVRRHLAEELLALVLGERRPAIVFAELGAGEVEVLLHLVLGQPEVLGHARVAQVLQRVAAGAVVHEQRGAALQRRGVARGRYRRAAGRSPSSAANAGVAANSMPATSTAAISAGRNLRQGELSHASSPVPAPAWSCRAWSTAAW